MIRKERNRPQGDLNCFREISIYLLYLPLRKPLNSLSNFGALMTFNPWLRSFLPQFDVLVPPVYSVLSSSSSKLFLPFYIFDVLTPLQPSTFFQSSQPTSIPKHLPQLPQIIYQRQISSTSTLLQLFHTFNPSHSFSHYFEQTDRKDVPQHHESSSPHLRFHDHISTHCRLVKPRHPYYQQQRWRRIQR